MTEAGGPKLAIGAAICHARGGPGTLGCFAWQGATRVLLSASHIIAPDGAAVGDWIYRARLGEPPDPAPAGRVARLLAIGEHVSAAALLPGIADCGNALPAAAQAAGGIAAAMTDPDGARGRRVAKVGAASGLTFGSLHGVLHRARVRTASGGVAVVRPAWGIVSDDGDFCRPGDSGALAFTLDPPAAVGLLYSVSIDRTGRQNVVVIPAHGVMARFGLRFSPSAALPDHAP